MLVPILAWAAVADEPQPADGATSAGDSDSAPPPPPPASPPPSPAPAPGEPPPETPSLEAGPDDVAMPPRVSDDEVSEHIIVIADPFARWDGTRWFIKTEVGLPMDLMFYADENWQFPVKAFQVRTILACEKDWKLSNTKWEVSCTIEDVGVQVVNDDDLLSKMELRRMQNREERRQDKGKAIHGSTYEQRREHVREILAEVDQKLTGAAMQLQVDDAGRVTAIDLEGLTPSNQRETAMAETLRQVMSRVIVGFDLRLQKWHMLEEGFWTEYSPKIMSMPASGVLGSASMGNSMMIHRLDRVDGHLIVESRGKGLIATRASSDEAGLDNNWVTSFAGVAVYNESDGYMTERVWTLQAKPTSSSWIQMSYWHAGRIVQLNPDQKPDVGPTQEVSMPCCPIPSVAPWKPLED
jgi:hypothetical protein